MEGFQDFAPGSARFRHPYIFQNRCLQKFGILKDKGYRIHQLFLGNLLYIDAADFHAALSYVPEPCHDTGKGGLSPA